MRTLWLFLAAVCITLSTSCGNHRMPADWRTSDDVHIAIDETFRPIMEEQVEAFSEGEIATVKPIYCSEDSAIRMLVQDSTRCIVVTRKLTDKEMAIVESHNLGAKQAPIAADAFALIVNKANPDTLITLDEIRGIVSGKITKWEQLSHSGKKGSLKLVFDNSGSSTVRYMKDSLCNGRNITGNVFASKGGNNPSVIDMVEKDPDIIGVVGTNWLKAKSDTVINDFQSLSVKVLKVARQGGPDAIGWKPYQYRIMTGDYPLVRSVYVITTDPRVRSTTKSMFYFLKGQKGQKIFLNSSQMLPYTAVQYRPVEVY